MSKYPPRLAEWLETMTLVPDRAERIQLLVDTANRYRALPEEIATRPYPDAHRTPACESEVYVWSRVQPDGTLKFHFAVENPQGISAMALAVIFDETLSGEGLEHVARLDGEVVYEIFGRELSMGKSMGLMGMAAMVAGAAKQALRRQSESNEGDTQREGETETA